MYCFNKFNCITLKYVIHIINDITYIDICYIHKYFLIFYSDVNIEVEEDQDRTIAGKSTESCTLNDTFFIIIILL